MFQPRLRLNDSIKQSLINLGYAIMWEVEFNYLIAYIFSDFIKALICEPIVGEYTALDHFRLFQACWHRLDVLITEFLPLYTDDTILALVFNKSHATG